MAQAQRKPEEERPEEERPPLREARPTEEERRMPEGAQAPVSWLAIVGLGLSLLAFLLPVILALFVGVAGAIMGGVALSSIRRGDRSGNAIAWGAIVVGGFVAILAIFALSGTLTGG
ncbi:MAG TPA: hypothetical protein VE439_10315 [Anaerolineae bacterium]|jgi:hypothetical protein|nr:hypothetical protein [Anaerolineae bacterium]